VTGGDATSIDVTAPSSATAGPVDVVVTTAGGPVTDTGGFTYVSPPSVTSLTPDSGPTGGGTTVVIGGTNLSSPTSVTFDGNDGTVTASSATSISVTTPAAPTGVSGFVTVVVTTAGGPFSDPFSFDYVLAPSITSVSPAAGPTAGGTSVTIGGTNLSGATSVTIGGNPAYLDRKRPHLGLGHHPTGHRWTGQRGRDHRRRSGH